jgi:hypothetical protein
LWCGANVDGIKKKKVKKKQRRSKEVGRGDGRRPILFP